MEREIKDIMMTRREVSEMALAHYGVEHQKRKAVEEMGELITAVSREQDNRAAKVEVITEIADVFIMMSQMAIVYGLEDVEKEIDRKLARLYYRIKLVKK